MTVRFHLQSTFSTKLNDLLHHKQHRASVTSKSRVNNPGKLIMPSEGDKFECSGWGIQRRMGSTLYKLDAQSNARTTLPPANTQVATRTREKPALIGVNPLRMTWGSKRGQEGPKKNNRKVPGRMFQRARSIFPRFLKLEFNVGT